MNDKILKSIERLSLEASRFQQTYSQAWLDASQPTLLDAPTTLSPTLKKQKRNANSPSVLKLSKPKIITKPVLMTDDTPA